MSATDRDTCRNKAQQANRTDGSVSRQTGQRCSPIRTRDAETAPKGVAAAIARMALLRSKSLTVNGAYIREPAAFVGPGATDQ